MNIYLKKFLQIDDLHDFNLPLSTQEEIRTPTPIQAPAPQAGASTNSATWVYIFFLQLVQIANDFQFVASTIPIAIGTANWVDIFFLQLVQTANDFQFVASTIPIAIGTATWVYVFFYN